MPRKATQAQLNRIKLVVKEAIIYDHIDNLIGLKHGWAQAAKILLAEVETLMALLIELDESWDLCPICESWICLDDCRYKNKIYPREKYPEKYDHD